MRFDNEREAPCSHSRLQDCGHRKMYGIVLTVYTGLEKNALYSGRPRWRIEAAVFA